MSGVIDALTGTHVRPITKTQKRYAYAQSPIFTYSVYANGRRTTTVALTEARPVVPR